ncbi:unnamed protein product [Lactuca virosa]|uniref:Uncharacterized protein n=1 Tax=Lactuca virosa TaxID=75947 RepID=A0AAU9M560_9ASTR|nr:unnamed protein product [Lactuca virosa]
MVKSTPSVWNEIFGFDLPIMRHLFWKSLAHPLCPVKLNVSNVPDDGHGAFYSVIVFHSEFNGLNILI